MQNILKRKLIIAFFTGIVGTWVGQVPSNLMVSRHCFLFSFNLLLSTGWIGPEQIPILNLSKLFLGSGVILQVFSPPKEIPIEYTLFVIYVLKTILHIGLIAGYRKRNNNMRVAPLY